MLLFSNPLIVDEAKLLCVSSSPSAECAAWSGNLCLCPWAVAVGASPAGDAGQHRGDERGESLQKGVREREKDGEQEGPKREGMMKKYRDNGKKGVVEILIKLRYE